MASPQQERGGYECEFVERPPELFQSECPICLLVLREPYQATCCGNSFCKTCIERIRAENRPCPTCNHAELTVFPDKRLQRSLYMFKVRCPHQREGCEWVGEFSELDRHLNTTPEFGKQLEGCQFVEVECIHCGEPFQRRHVEAHQNDSCPRRPFSCEYCRDYGADYEDVVDKHWPVCPCVPVPCPNPKCGVYPERQNLQHHVNEECPHQVVDCDFHYAGCEVRLPRKDMPAHLIKSLVAHVSLVATHSQKENEALKHEVTQLKCKLVEFESYTGVLPVEFTMTNFEKHKRDDDTWFSPPFYTHPYGYRMCLGVDANGCGEGKGTHVSVFAYLMHGKFDGSLLWPFQGHITIDLLNQLSDKDHCTYNCVSDRESISRVTTGERAGRTKGVYVFILHTALSHNPAKNCQYLKDDCLHFRVTRVTNELPTIQHEAQLLAIEPRTCVVPFEFSMRDFDQHTQDDDFWHSPAFYSNAQGYRMCFKVWANGDSNGKDTHVTVYVCLMRGEYDNSLKWPFRGDVTIQLLNQLEDSKHHTEIISFTDQTAGRVTHGGRGTGRGFYQFISHTDLGHNPARNCQYLMYDRLHFRINKVELK